MLFVHFWLCLFWAWGLLLLKRFKIMEKLYTLKTCFKMAGGGCIPHITAVAEYDQHATCLKIRACATKNWAHATKSYATCHKIWGTYHKMWGTCHKMLWHMHQKAIAHALKVVANALKSCGTCPKNFKVHAAIFCDEVWLAEHFITTCHNFSRHVPQLLGACATTFL